MALSLVSAGMWTLTLATAAWQVAYVRLPKGAPTWCWPLTYWMRIEVRGPVAEPPDVQLVAATRQTVEAIGTVRVGSRRAAGAPEGRARSSPRQRAARCGLDQDQRAIVVDHAQRSAGKFAAGRALDADLEIETLAGRDRGWQTPHVHARRMWNDDDAESRVGLLMADAVRLICHKHSPPDMLADFKRLSDES